MQPAAFPSAKRQYRVLIIDLKSGRVGDTVSDIRLSVKLLTNGMVGPKHCIPDDHGIPKQRERTPAE